MALTALAGTPNSPAEHAAIAINRGLGELLLKGMPRNLGLIELDSEAGELVRPHDADASLRYPC